MQEVIKPTFEKGKKLVAVGTLSALAILGIAGCSDTKETSFNLSVDCPAEHDIQISNIFNDNVRKASFMVTCGTDGDNVAPASVELSSSGNSGQDSKTESTSHNLEIDVSYNTDWFTKMTPEIETLHEKAFTEIKLSDVTAINRVEIVERKG